MAARIITLASELKIQACYSRLTELEVSTFHLFGIEDRNVMIETLWSRNSCVLLFIIIIINIT